jgi:hypothetical protein
MLLMALSDSRQVVLISMVGRFADAALATSDAARMKQNRLVARSIALVIQDTAGLMSVAPKSDFIVRLLVCGDVLA